MLANSIKYPLLSPSQNHVQEGFSIEFLILISGTPNAIHSPKCLKLDAYFCVHINKIGAYGILTKYNGL